MVVRIYRNHALGLGLMCAIISYNIGFSDIQVATILSALPNPFILLFLGLFALVDSTIPVARRSDPLLRSLFRWGKVRPYAWILNIAALVSWFLFDNGGFPPWALYSVILPIAVGVPALLVGARRSGDLLLRKSLRWVGLAVLFFGAGIMTFLVSGLVLCLFFGSCSPYNFSGSYFEIPVWVFLGLAAYSFYRSARSLAPLNRLESMDVKSPDLGAIRIPKPSLSSR